MIQVPITGLPPIIVAGIAVRTTNRDGQAQKDIGQLWGRFMQEGVADRIPDRLSRDIYCIYSGYEDQDRGAYDTLIGCRVGTLDRLPEGFSGIQIPALRYQVYSSSGNPAESVAATWRKIWNAGLPRLFAADFDFYPEVPAGSEAAPILTYVSVL